MLVTLKILGAFVGVMWAMTKAFFSFVWDYIFDRRFRQSIIDLWTEKL